MLGFARAEAFAPYLPMRAHKIFFTIFQYGSTVFSALHCRSLSNSEVYALRRMSGTRFASEVSNERCWKPSHLCVICVHAAKSFQGGGKEVVRVIDVTRIVHMLQDIQEHLHSILGRVSLGIPGGSQGQWKCL